MVGLAGSLPVMFYTYEIQFIAVKVMPTLPEPTRPAKFPVDPPYLPHGFRQDNPTAQLTAVE